MIDALGPAVWGGCWPAWAGKEGHVSASERKRERHWRKGKGRI
jgi:hypothetical protein